MKVKEHLSTRLILFRELLNTVPRKHFEMEKAIRKATPHHESTAKARLKVSNFRIANNP